MNYSHGQGRRHLSNKSVHKSSVFSDSGSVLGHICHLDPRAFTPLVGATTQREGVCSLQWSPGGKWLASGSTEGLLHIWDDDIMGKKMSSQPIMTVKQPSAVKVCVLGFGG